MRPSGSIVVPSGLHVEPHEIATAEKLKQLGYEVVFNRINNAQHAKNPDVTVNGEFWEFKSPQGAGASTISNQFTRGRKQAKILVIDLQRCGLLDSEALAQIGYRFFGQTRIQQVMVFDHMGNVTEFRLADTL
ncbi:hypothetical protein G7068_14685 [Leucobacter viscericola]|uniref:tRNA nuclease CdiA C-terminal domain-containing protein n=1 Tax=Leucobacter viscericola TaxID=2714935 RepID=A0A6G7XIQ1_9MICO|nr:hypothetical protein [Leucobacter viscericola]QIK64309.1 hypothetical protein G7068_14685 [Leucobacter viscericola]